jgi:hypothetical protein
VSTHRHRFAFAAVIVMIMAAFVCSGCGGSESQRLSKREYIEQFNAQQQAASKVFADLEQVASNPAIAAKHLAAFDKLIDGVNDLEPPVVWEAEHDEMLQALRDMRAAIAVIAKAKPANTKAINAAVTKYTAAQRRFESAVNDVNASR